MGRLTAGPFAFCGAGEGTQWQAGRDDPELPRDPRSAFRCLAP